MGVAREMRCGGEDARNMGGENVFIFNRDLKNLPILIKTVAF